MTRTRTPSEDDPDDGLAPEARHRAVAFARGVGHGLLDLRCAFVTRLCATADLEDRRERALRSPGCTPPRPWPAVKALRLTLSPSILLRADRVVE